MAIVTIPLGSRKYPGLVALIDEEDYERVSRHRWHVLYDGHRFYARATIKLGPGTRANPNRTSVLMHRFIMDAAPGVEVDHVNQDTLNNCRANLRTATRSQNCANRTAWNASGSGYKGIEQRPSGKWRALLSHGGKQINLGQYDTAEEAARAYDAKARELFGTYARLNFSS